MNTEELRECIRRKDMEIIRLVAERTEIAKEIGQRKTEQGLPIRNPEVEKKVIARYAEFGAEAGLDPELCRNIARICIEQAVNSEFSLIPSEKARDIAIIGGAGKMGKWMTDALSLEGHRVKIIDPASGNGLTVRDCADSDIVIVSVPIDRTDGVLKEADGVCRKDALIFDLSSLKTPVSATLKDMASRRKVCSVHPMFGPSAPSMFGRNLIVCDCGNAEAVAEAKELFDGRGGNIRVMDVDDHDRYMSYVLGMSHAVNIAFFTALDRSGIPFRDMQTVASTTFRKNLDTNVSVALEDPTLYYEIQHMNLHREEMWKIFSDAVDDLKKASLSSDPAEFTELMENGRKYFSE